MQHSQRGRKLLTAAGVARLLTRMGACNREGRPVHRTTVHRWWRAGDMPSEIVRGRRRMSVEQVENWYAANY